MRCALFCTMRNEIKSWIERGANYQEGVSLYDQYGDSSYLKSLFPRNDGSYNRKKLLQELSEIAGEQEDIEPALPIEQPIADPVTLEVHNLVSEDPQDATIQPPALLILKKQINDTWAELRGLHPYLTIYPPGQQLHQLQLQIVKLARKNAELYTKLDHYHEHGELPHLNQPVPKPALMIDINLLDSYESVRKSLNKAEQRIKKQVNPKPHTLALIKARRLELDELKRQILEAKGGASK